MNWRFHTLGASSTKTPPGDSTASFALSNSNRIILIDAGGNLPARLDRANLKPDKVTDIIITHSHPDHTYGLPFLSHSFYHDHREVTCWSNSEAIPRLKDNLEAFDLQEPDKYLSIEFSEVPTHEPANLKILSTLEIRSFPTNHTRESFGITLKSQNQKITYTADTGPINNFESIAEDTDILIHDCQGLQGYRRYFEGSHTSALELGRIADKLQVDVLVPFHHNLEEIPGGWEEIGTEIRENYDGNVIYPRQGMGFIL